MYRPAERMESVPFSGLRRVFEAASRLEKEGRDIVHLTIGRPDFDTPDHIKQAAKDALDAGNVHYTSNFGDLGLRRAIAAKLHRDNGVDYDAETEILVVNGVSEAISIAIQGFLGPGDEILVPAPAYLNYFYCTRLAGAVAVPVPLRQENSFQLDADDVLARITSRTRMLAVITPHNPTGSVCSGLALARLADVARSSGIIVLADEIYEKLVYDGAVHASIAALPDMRERTITLNGFSKAYSMTGWRIGYVAAPKPIIDVLVRLVQYSTVCPNSFAQAGAQAALEGSQESVTAMREEFDRRRRLVADRLGAIAGIACASLQGAFYAFPDVSSFGVSDTELADWLLQDHNVAVVPGSAFGPGGEGHLRLSYASEYSRLALGLDRLGNAFAALSARGADGRVRVR